MEGSIQKLTAIITSTPTSSLRLALNYNHTLSPPSIHDNRTRAKLIIHVSISLHDPTRNFVPRVSFFPISSPIYYPYIRAYTYNTQSPSFDPFEARIARIASFYSNHLATLFSRAFGLWSLLSAIINARQIGVAVAGGRRGGGLGASPAEFIERMIGVARRSGLTVVAFSYESKTLLKKPLLDLTRRARVRVEKNAASKSRVVFTALIALFRSLSCLLLLLFLLLPLA